MIRLPKGVCCETPTLADIGEAVDRALDSPAVIKSLFHVKQGGINKCRFGLGVRILMVALHSSP